MVCVEGETEVGHRRVDGLSLVLDANGIAVRGPEPGVLRLMPWPALRSLRFHEPGYMADGRPATALVISLADRVLRFLVPADDISPADAGAVEARLADLVDRFRQFPPPEVHVPARPADFRSPSVPPTGAVAPPPLPPPPPTGAVAPPSPTDNRPSDGLVLARAVVPVGPTHDLPRVVDHRVPAQPRVAAAGRHRARHRRLARRRVRRGLRVLVLGLLAAGVCIGIWSTTALGAPAPNVAVPSAAAGSVEASNGHWAAGSRPACPAQFPGPIRAAAASAA